MKKISLLLGLLIFSVVLFSFTPKDINEKEVPKISILKDVNGNTWMDLQYRIDTTIAKGNGDFVPVTSELIQLFYERNTLYFQENDITHGPSISLNSENMGFLQSCWACSCPMCGRNIYFGCSIFPQNCINTYCPYDGWLMYTGVRSCGAGYCGPEV